MNTLQKIFAHGFASLLGALAIGSIAMATNEWFVTAPPAIQPGDWMTAGAHWISSTAWMLEFTFFGMLTGAIAGWWMFRYFSKRTATTNASAQKHQLGNGE